MPRETRPDRIDREALVRRHNPIIEQPDPLTPLSVGNGGFAFTVDVTGLQTYPDFHAQGMPLGTLSHWGWHTAPNTHGWRMEDALTDYDVAGRQVPYLDGIDAAGRPRPATEWLRANPHRMDLGRVGLVIRTPEGTEATIEDVTGARQALDLWTGIIDSRFVCLGEPVRVCTVCDPRQDTVAARIESPLVADGRAGVALSFGYPSGDWQGRTAWDVPDRHVTRLLEGQHGCRFARTLDSDQYAVRCRWTPGLSLVSLSQHRYELVGAGLDAIEVTVAFSPGRSGGRVPTFAEVARASAAHWRRFWTTGGAIDLSGSRDPRWRELERRIVLSQYLTAIQCAATEPPQETGLTCDSWYGKFHLEMHWWHAVHFALWNRLDLLERSLPWYESILPDARATARMQGYRGARWPKMVAREGREGPSVIAVFLIWQQPHPIYFAELCYRERPHRGTLERWQSLVFETAEFMAAYARYDPAMGRYVLGPPLIPAQECFGHERAQLLNPTFELAYWRWGLEVAQAWRERLEMGREPEWDRVLRGLAEPTVHDGIYASIGTPPYYRDSDHPTMLAALGVLPPSPMIDTATMRRTLHRVLGTWQWHETWGWDYPMVAMTAARLGEPERALDALLIDVPKNRYLANGHNHQAPHLPLYLPGNGGLLAAVAMMAAGWDGCPERHAPGFPADGSWTVRWEGLRQMP